MRRSRRTSRCRSTARRSRSGCRCSCSMPTARSWPPTRSRSSRRASTTPTQTVLVKSLLQGRARRALRSQQFVRARIVWRTAAGLTVPVVGRPAGERPILLLRRRAPRGGPRRAPAAGAGRRDASANDYVVKSGLKAGDRSIVSGIQKLGDGAPGRSRSTMFVDTFITPADPRLGLLARPHPRRGRSRSRRCRWRSIRSWRRRRST